MLKPTIKQPCGHCGCISQSGSASLCWHENNSNKYNSYSLYLKHNFVVILSIFVVGWFVPLNNCIDRRILNNHCQRQVSERQIRWTTCTSAANQITEIDFNTTIGDSGCGLSKGLISCWKERNQFFRSCNKTPLVWCLMLKLLKFVQKRKKNYGIPLRSSFVGKFCTTMWIIHCVTLLRKEKKKKL